MKKIIFFIFIIVTSALCSDKYQEYYFPLYGEGSDFYSKKAEEAFIKKQEEALQDKLMQAKRENRPHKRTRQNS